MDHKLDEAGEACRAVVLFATAGIWRIYQNEIRAAGLQLPQKVETVAF